MDNTLIWTVLKWVLAALAAGFIGQFGRSLALHIIERRRAKKAHSPTSSDLSPTVLLERERLRTLQKIEKKRAKAEVKMEKKKRADP
jgi:hypothetical protein